MSTWSALWSSQGRDKQGHPQCPNGHPCTERLEGGLSPCHLLSSVSIHIKINPAGALHCLENAHGFHAHQVQVPISQTSGQSLSLRRYFSIIHLCFRLQLREILCDPAKPLPRHFFFSDLCQEPNPSPRRPLPPIVPLTSYSKIWELLKSSGFKGLTWGLCRVKNQWITGAPNCHPSNMSSGTRRKAQVESILCPCLIEKETGGWVGPRIPHEA